ncbi:MAG: RluA family pseudouridine synthase, partial [Syntrophothermus sp.]
HRIDRPVSGIVVFAKTSKSLSRMNILLRDGGIRKSYWAVVKNKPPRDKDHLVHFLRKNEAKNISVARDEEFSGSKKAELKYEVIGKSQEYYLLRVDLLTGRHHQIRAQLAKIGCPIRGDVKYGAERSNPDGSIHLHAREIQFVHPVKKEVITITADPPADNLWNFFKNIN